MMNANTARKRSAANISVPRSRAREEGVLEAITCDWEPRQLNTRDFPDQPVGQGAPPPTIANVSHVLEGNGVVVRYDVVKKRSTIAIPGLVAMRDNSENVTLAHVKSLLALHGMHNGDTRAIVDAIASANPYNPVREWIESEPWDGLDRLPEIYATIHTIADYPDSLKQAIMYRWLLSATAAAFMPFGFSTRLVLTLQGPQSIGKTRWCMSLVPDPVMRASVVKTDHHFDGGAKDNVITATRYWIVELGEVESSLRKDFERVKGILTRDHDVVRLPYAAADSEFPRRTVFMASANGSDFLSDPSGSTRWGVIAVESIDYEHAVDMQQLFAQLAADFHAGEQWWLTKAQEAELEAWNERHQSTSLVREAITAVVDFEGDDTAGIQRFTASELLKAADIEHPTVQQARECGSILRVAFGPPRKLNGYWRWDLPVRHGTDIDPKRTPGTPPGKSKFD